MLLASFFSCSYAQPKPSLIWALCSFDRPILTRGDIGPILLEPAAVENFFNRKVLLIRKKDLLPKKMMARRRKFVALLAFVVEKCCKKLRFLNKFYGSYNT